jgi:hypothetical protein
VDVVVSLFIESDNIILFFFYGDNERCGRVVKVPASYSGGLGSVSRPGDRLS